MVYAIEEINNRRFSYVVVRAFQFREKFSRKIIHLALTELIMHGFVCLFRYFLLLLLSYSISDLFRSIDIVKERFILFLRTAKKA